MKKIIAVALALCIGEVFCQTVKLDHPQRGIRSTARVVPDSSKVIVLVDVPVRDVQLMWMPAWKLPRQERKWWLSSASAPQSGVPYVAYFNINGLNAFSIGVSALQTDVVIGSKINQEKGVWEVTMTIAAPEGEIVEPFTVTLDRREKDWTEVLADWRASLEFKNGKYPEDAWSPVYCSWYARHADITQDWVERTAEIAVQLGFKTFILDDGWSYDERKRVSPKSIVNWYQDVGRWDLFSKKKFPDFKTHREKIRALGINYLVWVSPYFVGTRTPAYTKYGFDKRGEKPFEGNVLADPRDKTYMGSVDDQLVKLMKDADLDGLKIDFLDYIPPSVDKPRGRASHEYIKGLMAKLRSVKPDGLFEFRQSYATPLTASLATQFRAGDVPFEWLANLLRIAQIRLTMGDKVPVHSDPIFWSEYESEDNINRHFLASMAGVPMLSTDLEALSAEHRALTKKWIAFYNEKVRKFHRDGKWSVKYFAGTLQYMTSSVGDEVLVIVNDPRAEDEVAELIGGRKALVLNLTYGEIDLKRGRKVPAADAGEFPVILNSTAVKK